MARQLSARGTLIAVACTLVALLLAGLWLWRAAQGPGLTPGAGRQLVPPQTPAGSTAPEHEDFTEAERHDLEDALRRKGTGEHR